MIGKQSLENTSSNRYRDWLILVFVAAIAALVFLPIFFTEVHALTESDSDFPTHLQWAIDIKNKVTIPSYVSAHAAWQWLVLLFNAVLQFPPQTAELIAILVCVGVTASIIFHLFHPAFEKVNLSLWQMIAIVLMLNLATPVALYWFLDHNLYLGYIGIISYQNPTIILLRPLAILQFMYALKCFETKSSSNVFIPALISLLATFAKPNFAICLLPVIMLISLYKLFRREPVNISLLTLGFLVPTTIMLAWQLWMTYNSNDTAHIIFFPFGVMRLYSHHLFFKFFLSILFPLTITLLYWKQVIHNLPMILAWLIFIFGAFFTYFLAESGIRFGHGNFTWSGEITLFILFIISTLFLIEAGGASRIKQITAQLMWSLHIIFGIIYFLHVTFYLSYI